MNNFLTLSEVAEILRVNPEAVRRAAKGKKGKNPRLRGTKPGKEWRFDPADVQAYIDRGYKRPATETEQEAHE